MAFTQQYLEGLGQPQQQPHGSFMARKGGKDQRVLPSHGAGI